MYLLQVITICGLALGISADSDPSLNVTAGCTLTDFNQVNSILNSCTNIVVGNLRVPANKKLVLSLKSGATLTFQGTTIFDVGTLSFNDFLIQISGTRITVTGAPGSVINGQGEHYWDGLGQNGRAKPRLLHIYNANNARFQNINLKNCPLMCTTVHSSTNLVIEGWHADSSAGDKMGAKNTDGIGIANSRLVTINNAFIHNQDQCLYVNQGSDMVFTNIHCINSHGIAANAGLSTNNYEQNTVKNITFRNVVMDGGLYGIQLIAISKPGPGPGIISDINFENVQLNGIQHRGIWMQSDYGNAGHPNNNLLMTNIKVSNVHGTVTPGATAVIIFCGKCSNWHFSSVSISGSHQKNSCNFEPVGFRC